MSNPLTVLDPLEVKESANEILSESELFDPELGYFELREPYFLRRLKDACKLTGGRIAWAACGLIAATLGFIYSGAAWKNALPGLVVGVATLFVAWLMFLLFNFLVLAPWKMDESLRGNLKAAKSQVLEEKLKAVRAVVLVHHNYTKCFEQLTELKKNEFADIAVKIEEIYLKSNHEGLHITMRVVLTNRRADVTIQGFTVKFIDGSGEYTGQDIDVSDYSVVREEPSAYLYRKKETWKPLIDLRDLNTTLFIQKTHREGWLRFRLPELRYICTPKHGLVKLEILDASDRLYEAQISDPWPKQTGWISLTSRFDEPLSPLTIERVKKAPKKL